MRCPICSEPLVLENKTFKCANNHTFDKARQGYVNLSHKQKPSGDCADQVAARTRFLEKGYYSFLKDELISILKQVHPDVLIDLGCGQGWYTKDFASCAKESYGIDLSKAAIAHAAARDKKTQYIVGSIYHLPFEDQSADVLTSVFTPLPSLEASRVLKDDGLFVTVAPGVSHLKELKEQLYETVRLNGEPPAPEGFVLEDQEVISKKVLVEDVMSLLEMTPYYYKSPREGIERLKKAGPMEITFEFIISKWRKHED